MKYVIYLPEEKCFYRGNDYKHLVFFENAEEAARVIKEEFLVFKCKGVRSLDLKEAIKQLINDFEKSQAETIKKWDLCAQFVEELIS